MDGGEINSGEDNTMPSMDGDNKGMLDAIYANMDPSTMSINKPDDNDYSRCETR